VEARAHKGGEVHAQHQGRWVYSQQGVRPVWARAIIDKDARVHAQYQRCWGACPTPRVLGVFPTRRVPCIGLDSSLSPGFWDVGLGMVAQAHSP